MMMELGRIFLDGWELDLEHALHQDDGIDFRRHGSQQNLHGTLPSIF